MRLKCLNLIHKLDVIKNPTTHKDNKKIKDTDFFTQNPFVEFVRAAMACNNQRELIIFDSNSFKVEIKEKWITEKPILIKNAIYLDDDECPIKIVKFLVNPSALFSVSPIKKVFIQELGEFLAHPIHTYIQDVDKDIPEPIKNNKFFHSYDNIPQKAIGFGDFLKCVHNHEVATYYERECYEEFEKKIKIAFTIKRDNGIDYCYDARVIAFD